MCLVTQAPADECSTNTSTYQLDYIQNTKIMLDVRRRSPALAPIHPWGHCLHKWCVGWNRSCVGTPPMSTAHDQPRNRVSWWWDYILRVILQNQEQKSKSHLYEATCFVQLILNLASFSNLNHLLFIQQFKIFLIANLHSWYIQERVVLIGNHIWEDKSLHSWKQMEPPVLRIQREEHHSIAENQLHHLWSMN